MTKGKIDGTQVSACQQGKMVLMGTNTFQGPVGLSATTVACAECYKIVKNSNITLTKNLELVPCT